MLQRVHFLHGAPEGAFSILAPEDRLSTQAPESTFDEISKMICCETENMIKICLVLEIFINMKLSSTHHI